MGPLHVLGGNAPGHPFRNDLARDFLVRLDADFGAFAVYREHDRQFPFRHVAEHGDLAQRLAPVAADLDRFHRSVEAPPLVVAQKPVLKRLARRNLQPRIQRGTHGKPALVKGLVAVFLDDLAAHFLGEEVGGEEVRAAAARLDAERLLLCLLAVSLGDVTIFDHPIDHPVAALDRSLDLAERVVIGRPLGQGRKIGGLGNRQFRHRLVEIGQRRPGDAVGIQPEENLVEIELENAVLAVGLFDAEGEDRFLDLAIERLVGAQKEVLGDLLGDRRGADGAPTGAEILQVDGDGACKARHVDARMLVEVLVFRRDECGLDAIGYCLNGQI